MKEMTVRPYWRQQWFGTDPEKPPQIPRPPWWDAERGRWRGWVYVTGPDGVSGYARTMRR